MRRPVPTQAQLLAQSRSEARMASKKRYRRLLGIGFGAAGLATALAGLPASVSVGLWALSAASWAFIKAV
ncbi:MAG TPA: hypothetical protein VG943_16100 [Caulobacterales bacterium]|nr:hypothetical protein [Caulobacterales bacterium]